MHDFIPTWLQRAPPVAEVYPNCAPIGSLGGTVVPLRSRRPAFAERDRKTLTVAGL
jgi:hypothetical protein